MLDNELDYSTPIDSYEEDSLMLQIDYDENSPHANDEQQYQWPSAGSKARTREVNQRFLSHPPAAVFDATLNTKGKIEM